MSDKFTAEIEKLKRLEKIVRSDINKRNELEVKNQPTSILEAGIRGQFDEIFRVINLIKMKEIDSQGLPHNEVNRRHKIIQDIGNSINRMRTDYEALCSKSLMEKNKQNLLLNTNREDSDRNLIGQISTEEMMKLQKVKIKNQDEMLEEFHGLLVSSKKANQEINNEIRIQTPMLQNLEKEIDSTDNRIKRATKKLNLYYEKSSNSCLMTTICIQILILLVLVLVV